MQNLTALLNELLEQPAPVSSSPVERLEVSEDVDVKVELDAVSLGYSLALSICLPEPRPDPPRRTRSRHGHVYSRRVAITRPPL